MSEEELFAALVDCPTPEEQRALLAATCAGQPERIRWFKRLLASDRRPEGILDGSPFLAAGHFTLSEPEPAEALGPGSWIGPYRLGNRVGEGGFGEVYAAEQHSPIRRTVAIKLIKPGMDTREILRRFDAERQALALMEHAGIARVYDAGTTPNRRPYFVMEFVSGVEITEFCDREKLGLADRLRLFTDVCHAVQHAHSKGIIHRDLKPSNILVTQRDGTAQVKIIDFGVAKALSASGTDDTQCTKATQIIGTPTYMSPEQVEPGMVDMDTRADLYSLGVLLYELLTGVTPFQRQRLLANGLTSLRRIICEEEPPKPSTRIGTADVTLTEVAAARRCEPKRLVSQLRGELDWIVMKALEKDRERRYATANAFARDVQRYLANEPVEASPPSTLYRARKFMQRHRGPVLATTAVGVVLLAGIIGTSAGWAEAVAQQRQTQAAVQREREAHASAERRAEAELRQRRRAEAAEAEARKNEATAQQALKQTQAVLDFLTNDLLRQAGSDAQATRRFVANPNLTLREALDRAAASVGDKFADEPQLEAKLRTTIGQTYRALGLGAPALINLDRAWELTSATLGPTHPDSLGILRQLAGIHQDQGDQERAVKLLEQVRAGQMQSLSPDDPKIIGTLGDLAVAYGVLGKEKESFGLFEEVVRAKSRVYGAEAATTLISLLNLATQYARVGKFDEAIARYEQVRRSADTVLGPEHPQTLLTLNNLATAYWRTRQYEKSVPLFEHLLATSRHVNGSEHQHTVGMMANLGVNYRDAGRFPEAIDHLEKAHAASSAHPALRWIGPELALAYARAGMAERTRLLVDAELAVDRQALPKKSKELGNVLVKFAWALQDAGDLAQSEALLREAVAILLEVQPKHTTTFSAQVRLGTVLLEQQKTAAAEPHLLAGYAGLKKLAKENPHQPRTEQIASALDRLIKLYSAMGKPDEVRKWQEEQQRVRASTVR